MRPNFNSIPSNNQNFAVLEVYPNRSQKSSKINHFINDKEVPIAIFDEINRMGYFKKHPVLWVSFTLVSSNGDSIALGEVYKYQKGDDVEDFCFKFKEGLYNCISQGPFSKMKFNVDYIEVTIVWPCGQ